MSKLVIVESPNKIASIEKYLGSDYKVMASVGHIVRLPSSGEHGWGVNLEDWTPNYKIDEKKKDIVAKLKAAVKESDTVYVATDPDREGEAIADNLVTFLKLEDKYHRIRFNEITENAVKLAIEHPTVIDEKLVDSQIARRILDRIIGYKLSQLMRKKIANSPITPSAGRVQSIALKKVVEREREIEAFKADKYFVLSAQLQSDLIASYNGSTYLDNKGWIDPSDIKDIKHKLSDKELTVTSVKVSTRNDQKRTPFKQAVLYKRADSKLGLSSKAVQRAAQRLYEGYGDGGLISYPRTDSTRMSSTFVKAAQEYIVEKFGKEYLEENIKGTAGAQDAHEAIRPTSLKLTPELASSKFKLSPAEAKVYKLIYQNTMMSLMKVPKREILKYELDINGLSFKLSSSKVIYDGYLKVTGYEKSKELPKLVEGDKLDVLDYLIDEKETQPPARYNDGSLIETLDKIGVGRPSTFATTVNILKERMYVDVDGRALKATEFGKLVWEKLSEAFPDIMNEKYTANMESQLDEVAEGHENYKKLLDEFWKHFEAKVETATQELSMTKMEDIPAGKDCPECGHPLIVRTNKRDKTKFFGCSNFPTCRYTESDPTQKKKFFKWKKKTK